MVAADYPFLDVMWSMFVFFMFVIWIWMLIAIFGDIFSRKDVGGWGKTGWCIFLIVLPFLGAFVYLIAQGDDMAKRRMKEAGEQQAAFDEYVRSVAADGDGGGAAAEIEKAHKLLTSGAITQAEFDAIKQRALAAG